MKTGTRILIGVVAWVAFAIAAHGTPMRPQWTLVALVFAALVLVPLALDLAAERRDTGRIGRSMSWVRHAQLPAALLLATGCLVPPGIGAFLLTTPWAVVTALLASVGLERMLRDGWSRAIDRLGADIGLAFLVIGGIWALADRGGVRPLGFDPDVVALTAVHFHFAGFLLPLFAGQIAREMPASRLATRAIVGVVLGVPAVAVGITTTQLGWNPAIEAAAGCFLALAGMAVAILQVRWALDAKAGSGARVLVGISGVSLFFAMLLAAAYAVRPYGSPLPWLGLPQMRAVHGTINAFGFALCGLLGWRMFAANAPRDRG